MTRVYRDALTIQNVTAYPAQAYFTHLRCSSLLPLAINDGLIKWIFSKHQILVVSCR